MAEHLVTREGDAASNKHIRVTLISGDERKIVFLALREAFMLSPVLRENLPPPSDDPTQPTDVTFYEPYGMRLLLEALDDLAETDKKDEYNTSDQDGLEEYTGVGELYSALALADKYEVTRLFKTWCLLSSHRSTQDDEARVSRALCLWDPVMAKSVMMACPNYETEHPGTWHALSIQELGTRHWQTLIHIVTLHPDCLGNITENEPAGLIHWPTVAKYFPWGDKEYWALGPAGHDVIYCGPTRP